MATQTPAPPAEPGTVRVRLQAPRGFCRGQCGAWDGGRASWASRPGRSLADLHTAGVNILAGTDANDESGTPGAMRHGESLHHEFELMAQAGMTSAGILRSATVDAARAFGLTDSGTIAPGLRADLVLIGGDPLEDISATRDIRAVWCAGTEITAAANPPEKDG
ncbi:amidohydrolase family protein [Nonomuraea jabiensis]|uniref:amidohydrolase family protein n=1 Tax=Nonomuraea jabiensis TaxID=882448 RepID=UPI0036C6E83B